MRSRSSQDGLLTHELERASEALALGRADEARLYAWTALTGMGRDDARELGRIARALPDPALLRELERRGFSVEPVRAEENEPVERDSRRRVGRALLIAAVVLGVASFAVTGIPTESGPQLPTVQDASSNARFARSILPRSSGVWLVPLGEADSVNVARLRDELAARYRIPIAVLPRIALPRWTLDVEEESLVGDELIRLLRQAYRAHGSAAVIGITDFEMHGSPDDRTHVFAWRAPQRYGVVSTSTLAANVIARLRGHSRHERTRKLVARNVGFLFLRRGEVDDERSLLRSSMQGKGDLDDLEERL